MDNTVKDNPEKQNAKLLNIKPFPKLVCQSCLKVEPEELYFTDAQVISEKTKISNAVQMYNPNKVNKYGFSNIARAGELSYMVSSCMEEKAVLDQRTLERKG